MAIWVQIKDLPFSKSGAVWNINGDKILVDDCDHSYIDTYVSLVRYYTMDSGIVNMDGEYFRLAVEKDGVIQDILKEINRNKLELEWLRSKVEQLEEGNQGLEELLIKQTSEQCKHH
jgi:hypothetical protein